MSVVTIEGAQLLDLLTEVSRKRALTHAETDMLEDILSVELVPFRWDSKLDTGLQASARTPGGIRRFARRHGITNGAAYQRLKRIRARKQREAEENGRN